MYVNEREASYRKSVFNNSPTFLIDQSRAGVSYRTFKQVSNNSAYTLKDWAIILHLSERTLQRYEKEEKTFEAPYSERIFDILRLHQRGQEVFGTQAIFEQWMNTVSIALGGVSPKELLDTSFGIELLRDELSKIEHGVLA